MPASCQTELLDEVLEFLLNRRLRRRSDWGERCYRDELLHLLDSSLQKRRSGLLRRIFFGWPPPARAARSVYLSDQSRRLDIFVVTPNILPPKSA